MAGANRHRLPGQEVRHTLRANGTLLTGQWYELLAEHGFLVGISIGGPPALRDRYRVDKRGNPTFDKVVQGLRLLKKPNVEFDIQCTVNAADPDRPLAVYRYFRDELGARRLRFIPSSSGTTTPGSERATGRPIGRPAPRHGPVHDRSARGMGPPRRRQCVRAALRQSALLVAGDAIDDVRRCRGVR
ncbi:MAG TPA: hypothetical protein VFC03_21810 [Acidimicrobiales bacterium]|nr:hypothetical protein [Acidimicrobiales bacterium]